jgi:hypothetical protein
MVRTVRPMSSDGTQVEQNYVQDKAEMRIRCLGCDTTNACVRELPDQGRPTIRRTGPDWLIRTPGVSG